MPQITRVFDLLAYSAENFSKEDVVAGKKDGKWIKYNTADFVEKVNLLSRGLLALGIQKGDKVAIMSANCPEWNICDFGIMQTGATQVPMYPTLAGHDIEFILKDAGVKIVFVSGKELVEKVNIAKAAVNADLSVYTFDAVEHARHWNDVLTLGQQHAGADIEKVKADITPDDLLTLIYTSGTTGTPKGVMLTHNNLVSNVMASCVLFPQGYSKALSFLPLSHIFERMVVYMYFRLGISVYYAESLDTIVADINEVKPHGFTTVPRLLEKVYDRIVAKGSELSGVKKRLFFWALTLGLNYETGSANGRWYQMQLSIANKLIFKKWREALGGNILALISGGAALQPRLARVFWAAGIPVLEGYGLTETSPVIAVNGLGEDELKFTTVGKPIKGVEVKIAADGEILCKGPNVMKGYYNRPDLTAEVIDADGFFHTGDIGELIDGKYLRITDRKKEIFKTAGGKYVAPQLLENKYKESPLIEQVMVVGENRKFPCALIVPSATALQDWCYKNDIAFTSVADAVLQEPVIAKFKEEIDQYNREFGKWEQVKRFKLLAAEWSIDGGELTPKLSLRRKVIFEKNKTEIEKLYEDSEHIHIH